MSDPWQEPVRGGYPDPSLFALSGVEQLRAMLDGQMPQPPISRLTGMRLAAVGDGTATFEMPLSEWLLSPQGAIPIGPLVMPADAAMACAIQTTLPPAIPFSTSELTMRLLHPARPGVTVRVTARVIQVRETLALADAAMTDATGQLIAHGSSICLMSEPIDLGALPGDVDGHRPEPGSSPPDPWQRAAVGTVIDQATWDRMSGLEVLQAQLSGELPPPPIHHLTGLRLLSAEHHQATFEMPGSEWLCAPPRGRVQGGGTALLAEAALASAIQTTVPASTAVAPIDLKVNYLRPFAADGRPALAHGVVVHRGRRIAVADSRVLDADGRTIAVATGSAMILPGRPAALGAAQP